MTSLLTTGYSMFLLRLPGKLGHQSYRAMLMIQPVLRLKMNAIVVDRGFQQKAVEGQPHAIRSDLGMALSSVCLSVTLCIVALMVGLYRRVPSRAFPIHFFRHFCCRMYRLATKYSAIQIDFIADRERYSDMCTRHPEITSQNCGFVYTRPLRICCFRA